MIKYDVRAWILLAVFLAASCGPVKVGRGLKKVINEDFAEGRIVDVSMTEKLTGNKEMLFMSIPKKTEFLEGYVQGVMTDYQDNPIQGVVVRAVAVGEAAGTEAGPGAAAGLSGSSFDPGVSDSNGFYRIRFSLPIINDKVDVRGRILYAPGWEQERDNLGKSYEPQTKQSQFRLFFERKRGRITFTEGIRKTVVAAVSGAGKATAGLPSALPGAASGAQAAQKAPEKAAGAGGDEDLFKGFGFGQ